MTRRPIQRFTIVNIVNIVNLVARVRRGRVHTLSEPDPGLASDLLSSSCAGKCMRFR